MQRGANARRKEDRGDSRREDCFSCVGVGLFFFFWRMMMRCFVIAYRMTDFVGVGVIVRNENWIERL